MRIIGILLILIGVPLIGWFGYVELFYLDEIKSGFEEQRIKSRETINAKIKETEDKFNKVKDNLKKRKIYPKNMERIDENRIVELFSVFIVNHVKKPIRWRLMTQHTIIKKDVLIIR